MAARGSTVMHPVLHCGLSEMTGLSGRNGTKTMMCDNVVRLAGQGAPVSFASQAIGGSGGIPAEHHVLALRMHRFSLARDAQFQSDVLRNPAWDMLLSLFVARQEGLDAPFSSLCVANRLSAEAGATAVQALSAMFLVEWDAENPNGHVALTQRGFAQIDQFLQRVALSA
jgi:hypothetical protein